MSCITTDTRFRFKYRLKEILDDGYYVARSGRGKAFHQAHLGVPITMCGVWMGFMFGPDEALHNKGMYQRLSLLKYKRCETCFREGVVRRSWPSG